MTRLLPSPTLGILVALLLGVIASTGIALFASVMTEGTGDKDVRVYSEEVATRAGTPYVVTSVDLAAAGAGSPGEALLQSWQAMQTAADVEAAASYFTPAAEPERVPLVRKLETLRYLFQQSKPRLIDSRVRGDQARVVAVLASGGDGDRKKEQHALEVFELERVGGRWRVGRGFVERRYEAEISYAAESQTGAK